VNWPRQTPESNLIRYYGEPGENQVRIKVPYPHIIAWDTSKVVKSFLCHEKVHDSLLRVLTNVLDAYGMDDIEQLRLNYWGGCLNVRPMTSGSRLSLHAWGIALDYDPVRNRFRMDSDEAAFAQPEYDTWWTIWEDEGWVSLGRERDYDWMHVQAARL
jgi:hypothetical protein